MIPCGETCNGVEGTLRPVPESSNWLRSILVSSIPSEATCATPKANVFQFHNSIL